MKNCCSGQQLKRKIVRRNCKWKMITHKQYTYIANKYGHYASWAVWKEQGDKPKSNVGDLTIFDINLNPTILEILNPNFIMIGLNISRPIEFKFGNFHDKRPQSQDYKIRYAFNDTMFYGAYMTDIIKDFENVVSGDVMKYVKANEDFERKNIERFIKEINDIGATAPTLIAFGNYTHSILTRHFEGIYPIIKFPHYSIQISKEDYKIIVERKINEYLDISRKS